MNRQVLLVNPPSPFLTDQAVFPSLGLLYLAAVLQQNGDEPHVIDLGLGDKLEGYKPDLIGITGLTVHVPYIRKLVVGLDEMYPTVPVILGGVHLTLVPEDGAKLGVDDVCIGDGEVLMLSWATRQSITADINQYPKPARRLIDLHRYHYHIDGRPATSMMTARGCPYKCAFCSRGPTLNRLRFLAMGKVEEELDDIQDLGFSAVQLYDDEVNINANRLKDLCDVFIQRDLRWRAFIRADKFNPTQAIMMGLAGCHEVCCGVESGSNQILQKMNKGATIQQATDARRYAEYAGLKFKAFCIVGLPGETEQTAQATKDWLLANRPDAFDICPFVPYPGSHIWNHPNEYDIQIEADYWETPLYYKGVPGEYKSFVRTSALAAERIVELRDEIDRDVRRELYDTDK